MAFIKICDRCGAQIAVTDGDVKRIVFNSGHCTRMFNKSGLTSCLSYDLCGKCDDELGEFLKKKE